MDSTPPERSIEQTTLDAMLAEKLYGDIIKNLPDAAKASMELAESADETKVKVRDLSDTMSHQRHGAVSRVKAHAGQQARRVARDRARRKARR